MNTLGNKAKLEEVLVCDHNYINAGFLQGNLMKRCIKCCSYIQLETKLNGRQLTRKLMQ